jgi:heme/copper-type cytochrome/quinol oxidase subunit 3
MIALPPGPNPAPSRQLLVATALAGSAAAMLIGGMLAVWLRFRAAAPSVASGDGLVKAWVPDDVAMPEVAANVMLITLGTLLVMAQWAVYAAKRQDRGHAALALGVTFLMGVAALNSQIYAYSQMELGIADGVYQVMFYAITGTFTALLISGLAFTAVTAFRYLGGRSADTELVASHALYWYLLTAVYVALWFVVYVQK